ncbi:MAG: hypothetical protein WDW36_005713 [Sanguina aurantia]
MSSLQSVKKQVDELDAGKANNVVSLLSVISVSSDKQGEVVVKAALQGLKVFFVKECQRVDVHTVIQAAADSQAAQPAAATPEQTYQAWLTRQLAAYVTALFTLLAKRETPAGIQVCAVMAVMELVRCVEGTGVFATALFRRLMGAVLLQQSVKPEVFMLLFSRYFQFADVRYYTLTAVAAIAQENSGGGSGATPASASAPAAATDRATALPAAVRADLPRNLFDTLEHVPETVGGESGLTSWCGATEVGLVVSGTDTNESSKARRKRKQGEMGGGSGADAQQRNAVWANEKNQRRVYGDAWLALLQLPIPPDILRKVLLALQRCVMPSMLRPVMLCDFLTHAVERGGLVGMLALNGLFVLVTQHGLEYPQFFSRLYQLLQPGSFTTKHRVTFFRLADLFLSSGLVPAYTAAAFIKRFARLALTAPPAGAVLSIAFIHNLLRRHPACMVMVHKPSAGTGDAPTPAAAAAGTSSSSSGGHARAGGEDEDDFAVEVEETEPKPSSAGSAVTANGGSSSSKQGSKKQEARGVRGGGGAVAQQGPQLSPGGAGEDVYNDGEGDPALSRAVESSLWELTALRQHYCPQVATFCSILDKDLGDRTKTSEVSVPDLLSSSYGGMFKAEAERRLKKAPTAFYAHTPKTLFGTDDVLEYEDKVDTFIKDVSLDVLEFPHTQSTYHRKLAHRVAQHYGLSTSTVEHEDGQVHVVAKRSTRVGQQARLSTLEARPNSSAACPAGSTGTLPHGETPRLLTRPGGPDPTNGNGGGEGDATAAPVRSAKERQEDYMRDKERLLGQAAGAAAAAAAAATGAGDKDGPERSTRSPAPARSASGPGAVSQAAGRHPGGVGAGRFGPGGRGSHMNGGGMGGREDFGGRGANKRSTPKDKASELQDPDYHRGIESPAVLYPLECAAAPVGMMSQRFNGTARFDPSFGMGPGALGMVPHMGPQGIYHVPTYINEVGGQFPTLGQHSNGPQPGGPRGYPPNLPNLQQQQQQWGGVSHPSIPGGRGSNTNNGNGNWSRQPPSGPAPPPGGPHSPPPPPPPPSNNNHNNHNHNNHNHTSQSTSHNNNNSNRNGGSSSNAPAGNGGSPTRPATRANKPQHALQGGGSNSSGKGGRGGFNAPPHGAQAPVMPLQPYPFMPAAGVQVGFTSPPGGMYPAGMFPYPMQQLGYMAAAPQDPAMGMPMSPSAGYQNVMYAPYPPGGAAPQMFPGQNGAMGVYAMQPGAGFSGMPQQGPAGYAGYPGYEHFAPQLQLQHQGSGYEYVYPQQQFPQQQQQQQQMRFQQPQQGREYRASGGGN